MSVCRLLLKIILFPVSIVLLLINLVINLTSVVVGLFTLYIGFALVYCIISQRWRDMMIFLVIGITIICVMLIAVILEETFM